MFSDELTMSLISISIQNTVDSKIRERAVVDYFDLVGLFQNTIGTRALPATLRVFLEHFWTLYGRDPSLMFPAFRDALRSIPTSADPIVAAAIERAAAATIFCETAGGCDDCAVEILHILRIIYGTNQGAASGAAVLALLRKEHSRSHNQHP